ncbi:heparinase II/III family protein [Opitutus sp. ER46]|uniref:heparinase II/III domain-containing protein n=1 Tax=Opitutus sp. ER46 TaxID=2161864 RepID=UPI000D306E7D|nr:heparinase II/III family protein [Opitutus sp. ER46]PTX98409.1 heparinase [Opitutus sp. ER46]
MSGRIRPPRRSAPGCAAGGAARWLGLALVVIFLAVGPAAWAEVTDVLATLRPGHPRLLATDDELARVRQRATTDPLLRELLARLQAQAEATLSEPTVQHALVGPRMLEQSRQALRRVLTGALAYRISGDERFAARAKREMLTAAAFPDWNPTHFLDVAEMSLALAVGYDWLYAQLTPDERATVHRALVDHALAFAPAAYAEGGPADHRVWWVDAEQNWNQVCNGGLLAAALALAEDEPELARLTIAGARRSLPRAMAAYRPDGAYPEGPGYWDYGTTYNVLAIALLESALQQESELARIDGLGRTARYRVQAETPAGQVWNYADTAAGFSAAPVLGWLSTRYGYRPGQRDARERLATALQAKGRGHPAGQLAWQVLWLPPPTEAGTGKRTAAGGADGEEPKDARFRGAAEVAMFRSAWHDPAALFAGLKAGRNDVNHAHLDLGSFVLESDGVRWALDLGPDNYNLPAYFSHERRWGYFRLGNLSHNTLTPGDRLQERAAAAPIVGFRSTTERAFAVADLTSAYPGSATTWRRGVAMLDRARVLVADEWRGRRAGENLSWRMMTSAEITLGADGRSAILRANGRTLRAELSGPADARFTVASATPPTPAERQNVEARILTVILPAINAPADAELYVLFTPVGPKWPAKLPPPALTPPSEWR